jgi:hypothetical protein
MKLPNHEHALVPQEKITGYLLSLTHRDGRHKAAFFVSFGSLTSQQVRPIGRKEIAQARVVEVS